jgi:hypothetical protein
MPPLQPAGMSDLIAVSLPDLGRMKFTDLMTDYYDTIALKRIFNKKKSQVDSGTSINFNIAYDIGGSFRFVPMNWTATANIKNVMTTGNVPWRGFTWNWSMILEEPIMNSGASRIVELVKIRRMSEFASVIVGLERHIWTAPDPTDEVSIYPIPYWIVKSNTAVTTNNGFNGTVPTGFTTVGGLTPTTAPGTPGGRYRNYATQYTTIAKNDLVRKMRHGARYTGFKPIAEGGSHYDTGDDMAWYSNYSVVSVLEEILESQNENLGKDLASMDGKSLFRGAPIEVVQELDNDTTNPVYGIQWATFGFVRMRGVWMKDIPIPVNPNQPTMSTVHNISRTNTVCYNRRRNMVFATDTTMPS